MSAVSQALIEHEPVTAPTVRQDTAPAPMTPMEMISQAVAAGQPIEVIRELMELSREIKREQAREAFDAAVADAKKDIPVVAKNAKGHNDKLYADFSAYAKVVDPIIGLHGLSYRFRTTQAENKISVTCILSHRAGHSEENTLAGPSDTTGSKNAIQAIGSTLTYLQRYTLVQALGLAAGIDDDGKAMGKGEEEAHAISEEQAGIIRALIDETATDIAKLCEVWKIEAVPDLTTAQFPKVVAQLETKKRRMAK